MFANVTVVVPTTNGLQVTPSVEYSSDTDGPLELIIFTVEFAYLAVKQSSGLGIGSEVHPVGIALAPCVVSDPL